MKKEPIRNSEKEKERDSVWDEFADFIKDKYAPKWFKDRWPVQYTSKKVKTHSTTHFMCPHLPTESSYPHVLWLKMNQDHEWQYDARREWR